MEDKFKIEKGVPIPPKRIDGGLTDALIRLEIGDCLSFLVSKGDVQRMRNNALQATRQLKPKKFTSRVIGDKVKIWRTE